MEVRDFSQRHRDTEGEEIEDWRLGGKGKEIMREEGVLIFCVGDGFAGRKLTILFLWCCATLKHGKILR